MSRFCLGLALWALLLALAACGGDSKGTDPARDTELADSDSAKDAESGEKVDAVVPTFDDLLACTRDHEGATAYVEDEDSAYVCKKGLWVVDDSLTKAVRPDSEKKSSSSAKAKSSSNETSESSSSAKSSSSKDSKSSSSDEKNSSSSSVVTIVSVVSPCKTETEDNCEYGSLTDDRDGQTYKTVKIGEQWWMAENLNYRYIQQTAEEDSSSYCYNDDPANCAKYGRLYLWSAALVVCPEGWHLPDSTEWETLRTAVGGWATAGKMLKSTEGWNDNFDGTSGNGSDSYSFSALPAGLRGKSGNFRDEGYYALFWSSTEKISNVVYYMALYRDQDNVSLVSYYTGHGLSVRCLKD